MNLEPNDLLLFARVADNGSFSRGAERLGLPKSTVSRRIAALEGQLGERLFTRSTRRLALTDFGRSLLDHARRVVEEVEAVAQLAQQRQAEPAGHLRVSMPSDLAALLLAPAITAFSARYPRLRLDLDLSARRVDLVGENFDLAVRVGTLPDDATLVARKWCDFSVGLFAAPAYLARHGTPATPQDLPDHTALRLLGRDGEPAPWRLERGSELWEAVAPGTLAANSLGALIRLAREGAGIVAANHLLVEPYLARGELAPVLADWSMPPATAWLVMPSRRLIPPKTRAFIECLLAAREAGTGVAGCD
jgi:DNA-binding transcriptional LysR family regulator